MKTPIHQQIEAIMARIASNTYVQIHGSVMPTGTFQKLRDAVAAIKEDARILDEILNDQQPIVFGHEASNRKAAAWIDEVSGWASDCGPVVKCESIVEEAA